MRVARRPFPIALLAIASFAQAQRTQQASNQKSRSMTPAHLIASNGIRPSAGAKGDGLHRGDERSFRHGRKMLIGSWRPYA